MLTDGNNESGDFSSLYFFVLKELCIFAVLIKNNTDMANRNKLDRKGRPHKKVDNITYSGMRHWDICRHLIGSGTHGNLKKYYLAGMS